MEILKNSLFYIFNPNPGQEFSFYIPLLIFAGLLIIGSIVFNTIYHRKRIHDFAFKKLFRKVSTRLFIFGVIILILTGIRYETIPYFSMRLWLFLVLLLLAYMIYHYLKVYFKIYPIEKENAKPKEKSTINTYGAAKWKRK